MFINYIIWIIVGVGVAYLGYYFDVNKKKGFEPYLFAGVAGCYLISLLVHFFVWTVPVGDINFVAPIVGGIITYYKLRVIDYYFHL